MSIQCQSSGDILTIAFLDPRILDDAKLNEVSKEVLEQIDRSTDEKVLLDFQLVQFMSSSMLGKLVQIHKKCKEFKVKLKLCSISPEILEVFRITKLDKLFDIHDDAESARKAFNKQGFFSGR